MVPFRYFFGHALDVMGLAGMVTIPSYTPAPYAIILEPPVMYAGVYEAAKNNGREYDWWAVT